jgi:hypothetical protein
MAAVVRTAHLAPAPRWIGALAATQRRLLMYGDAHGWMTALLAIVMVIGDVVLVALGRTVPGELSYGLLLVFGFFFGRAFAPSPPAPPPAAPARPQLVIPGHSGGDSHAAD